MNFPLNPSYFTKVVLKYCNFFGSSEFLRLHHFQGLVPHLDNFTKVLKFSIKS